MNNTNQQETSLTTEIFWKDPVGRKTPNGLASARMSDVRAHHRTVKLEHWNKNNATLTMKLKQKKYCNIDGESEILEQKDCNIDC